jgi:dTDP-4-dehydrorhamnose reductase
MKILLIGGSGTLGKEIRKQHPDILLMPSHNECNITNYLELFDYVVKHKPELIINAAAVIDNRRIDKTPSAAILTNIIGAAHVANVCSEFGIRLVFISTDYVYKGDRGNYKETDEILPFNNYAWSKLGGECSARLVKNHLIIRTSFGKDHFEYKQAFTDKWSSKDYVSVIAPLICEAAESPLTGVLNLGTERKTLFAHANEKNDVRPVKLSESNHNTPYDTSLNLQKWYNYKSEKAIAKPHTGCRVCGSENLVKYLDLGLMPLSNNLEFTSARARESERFPLQVMFCPECSLSQLSVVIDPEKMFSYYTYRSSVNGGYVKHCREMAKQLQSKYSLNENSFHIDIAGNDGTLLKQFHEEIGLRVLNVDPATNLAAISESQGIESIADFWSSELARKIVEEKGHADLITATNVFAHVDKVGDFINAASIMLKPDGVLVLEFPYLVNFIEGFEFDTVYFEHLSYVSVLPVQYLCNIYGLKIISVEPQNIHGGTIRVSIAQKESSLQVEASVQEFIDNEIKLGYDKVEKYAAWSKSVKDVISAFSMKVLELKKKGFKIAAFAASAKGNTLLNSSSMNTDIIDFIADETPEKIGKFSPGTGIKILNKQQIEKDQPDYLIILSWNFKDEIIEKLSKFYHGKFIIPIPTFEIIEQENDRKAVA